MEWEKATTKDGGFIKVPSSWLFLHYYEALTVLFRIENALRVFVFIILKNVFRDKWTKIAITDDGSNQDTIESIAKKRVSQARSFGYLGYSISCPLMHLTTGELIRLITSDANWKYFKKYFSGSKEIMKNKLDEIGNVRNSIAHFRPIKEEDVELVKQNAKHVLADVEKCISDMIECGNVVPTNTTEKWYQELGTLGSDNCTLSFNQSGDAEWVRVNIEYNCPIISQSTRGKDYITYRVLNIISSAILKEYPILSNAITYLFEDAPYVTMDGERPPDFKKDIMLVFSQEVLKTYYNELKEEIKKILLKVSEETELIKQDNLAKGKLVEAVHSSAYRETDDGTGRWRIWKDNFFCPVKEDDPPEFWGIFYVATREFISGTDRYPWMPIEISEAPFPF